MHFLPIFRITRLYKYSSDEDYTNKSSILIETIDEHAWKKNFVAKIVWYSAISNQDNNSFIFCFFRYFIAYVKIFD